MDDITNVKIEDTQVKPTADDISSFEDFMKRYPELSGLSKTTEPSVNVIQI